MSLNRTVLAAGIVAAIGLGVSSAAIAHSPRNTSSDSDRGSQQYGRQMGPMQGQNMGRGYGQNMGPGYGQYMGPGYGMGQGMRPGYGQYRGPGYGMGPGYGQNMGPGYGQGMGPGYGMGQGMMQPLPDDLTAAEVKHMMEHRLAWQGNPNVKVGKVEEKNADTIVAEIVTQDGSLVQKFEVDRHTGRMQPVR